MLQAGQVRRCSYLDNRQCSDVSCCCEKLGITALAMACPEIVFSSSKLTRLLNTPHKRLELLEFWLLNFGPL
jgi:hypothetical protein